MLYGGSHRSLADKRDGLRRFADDVIAKMVDRSAARNGIASSAAFVWSSGAIVPIEAVADGPPSMRGR